MNHVPSRPPVRNETVDPTVARSKENPTGIDDIGLPADVRAENARPLSEVDPDPARAGSEHDTGRDDARMQEGKTVNPDQPEPELPPEEAEKTALEKVITKVVPPSHEVRDDDIMDPGHMTPHAPPVDNRS